MDWCWYSCCAYGDGYRPDSSEFTGSETIRKNVSETERHILGETSQWDGERSIAGADLYDRPLCGNHQPCDRGDDGLVSQEVLAVLVTAMSIGGHCLLRGCREAGYAKRAARP